MNKFYVQNVLGTLGILGAWALALFLLTSDSTKPQIVTKTAQVTSGPREVVEPRDEATGEEARVHRFNADDQRVQMEVKFKDKTTGLMHFNLMGRPSKIEERYPDGSSQVFFLRPNGSLAKRQSFRKDNTLKSETMPAAENTVMTRVFGEDGKTLVRTEQMFQDGSTETVSYAPDGKTPQLRYKSSKDDLQAVLTTYDESGKVQTVENIERDGNNGSCGDPMCHECGGEIKISMTRYRADGTVHIKGNWLFSYGSTSIESLEEYGADGKTVVRRIKSESEKLPNEATEGDNYVYTKVEKFDEKGKLRCVRWLRGDNTVGREQTAGEDGKLGEPVFHKKDTKVKEEQGFEDPRSLNLGELLPKVTPQPEPNHLQQMFSR